MDEKPTKGWINKKNFRKTSFGITESQTCTWQCLHLFIGSFLDVDNRGRGGEPGNEAFLRRM